MQQDSATLRVETTPLEAAGICIICFGWAILTSVVAATGVGGISAFNDESLIGLIFIENVLAAVALLILRARRYAVATLYPEPSLWGAVIGVGLGIGGYLAAWALTAPFAARQAPEPIDLMVAEAQVTLATVVGAALVNGAYEEMALHGIVWVILGISRPPSADV